MAFHLLRCLAKAVVKHGPRLLLDAIPWGERLYDIAYDAWEDFRRDGREDALRAEVQALAQAPPDQVRREVEQAVQAGAAGQPEQVQRALRAYLNQVPAAIRQSLRRPEDPTGTTVPANLALRKAEDLLPLLPPWPPGFQLKPVKPQRPAKPPRPPAGSPVKRVLVGMGLALLLVLAFWLLLRTPTSPERIQAGRKAGEVVSNRLGMKFAWCPPGTFLMGSPEGEKERLNDEKQHRVTLTQGYYLGVYEVTQARWQAVMDGNPSRFKGDDKPVENVSWEDCQEFCKKLAAREGKRYRLPTEAEWEYACRAGTTTPFHFGETISTDQANYDGKYIYADGKKGKYRGETTPVGSFPANAWGLYDMHGNVWEWCQDTYTSELNEDIKDPLVDKSGDIRVPRGGSGDVSPRGCRAACRGGIAPGLRHGSYGCRVVLGLD
jgi:formylglycine-generating enzyme required for sulfatase activity